MKKINFYSGPAILPEEVLEQSQMAIRDFAGTGLSILEISHRSKEFIKVMEEARALVKELLQLKEDREVLFLQGGGSSQFYMVPLNLLGDGETASYFDTGQWAHGAMEEAKNFGKVQIACSSRDQNYDHIPKNYSINPEAKYLHITSNNTVFGTQFHWWPEAKCPVVADMSSDIFSRQLDFNRFDLIYAGAQKNMGPAGATLVVVNKNLLGKVNRKMPKMADYRVHIDKDSMHNTPSVFAVYVCWLTLKWIKQQGLKTIEEKNMRKAKNLYDAIDASSLFEGSVARDDRSLMNVCFRIDKNLSNAATVEEKFLQYANEQGMVGIKGYRTVGGFRASIYNAMPESGVQALVEVMKEFERSAV
ncbi:MAG: 3-phosphoserine/phosphohydroxythreonine aminotransferase [Bacteroidota bacterium]|nr:3-phosphoserine/phosphohydroxythreonine aminotransferase [Bacteroidota bacterium]